MDEHANDVCSDVRFRDDNRDDCDVDDRGDVDDNINPGVPGYGDGGRRDDEKSSSLKVPLPRPNRPTKKSLPHRGLL